jgi:hypothetical protein
LIAPEKSKNSRKIACTLVVSPISIPGFMLPERAAQTSGLGRASFTRSFQGIPVASPGIAGRAAKSGLRSLLFLCFLGAIVTARAEGLDDLLNQEAVTPDGVARVCAGYSFELNPTLQSPETFLQRKRGDCADFANLASIVLSHWGYHPKMVVVMMAKQTHVVCYVKEVGGFLDYNHRADSHPVIPSDGSLEDIAGKVCRDFRSEWHLASAFRYHQGSPYYLETTFPSDESAAKRASARASASHISFAVQAVIP